MEAMMRESDTTFYRRRALQEQVAAARATCAAARERHDELAAMYWFRLAMVQKRPECWGDVLEIACEQVAA